MTGIQTYSEAPIRKRSDASSTVLPQSLQTHLSTSQDGTSSYPRYQSNAIPQQSLTGSGVFIPGMQQYPYSLSGNSTVDGPSSPTTRRSVDYGPPPTNRRSVDYGLPPPGRRSSLVTSSAVGSSSPATRTPSRRPSYPSLPDSILPIIPANFNVGRRPSLPAVSNSELPPQSSTSSAYTPVPGIPIGPPARYTRRPSLPAISSASETPSTYLPSYGDAPSNLAAFQSPAKLPTANSYAQVSPAPQGYRQNPLVDGGQTDYGDDTEKTNFDVAKDVWDTTAKQLEPIYDNVTSAVKGLNERLFGGGKSGGDTYLGR